MRCSPFKIWTIDRLHIQREIHNSIIITIDFGGEDGRPDWKQNPAWLKVFCDSVTAMDTII